MGNGESTTIKCPGGSVNESTGVNLPTRGKLILDDTDLEKFKIRSVAHRELLDDRLERYINSFTVKPEQLRLMMDAFIDELQLGLELYREANVRGTSINPKECSFKMLDSCVKDIPTGDETGVYYAIDFGGTNLRAVRLLLRGSGSLEISQYKTSLTGPEFSRRKGLMDKEASATEMFDFFALTIKKFMKEQGDLNRSDPVGVGFTFSFPCSQRKIDSAHLVTWTKHFETGRETSDQVEGQDVCELLQIAFQRNKVPAICSAVLNDTVGTLLSCAYEMDHMKHPRCLVGIILGTGMNACYFDENCPYYNYQGNIINVECGNFNRELPRTNVDLEVDFASTSNRGEQLLEKMISGAYLGEICRRTIVKVYQKESPAIAWEAHSLPSEECSAIANDKTDNCIVTRRIIEKQWGVELQQKQYEGIHRICYQIFDRSAALASVVIAACAKKSGFMQRAMGGVTVGVDGSLYKCNLFYRERLRAYLTEVIEQESSKLIHLVLADDGSGKGAGILASTIS